MFLGRTTNWTMIKWWPSVTRHIFGMSWYAHDLLHLTSSPALTCSCSLWYRWIAQSLHGRYGKKDGTWKMALFFWPTTFGSLLCYSPAVLHPHCCSLNKIHCLAESKLSWIPLLLWAYLLLKTNLCKMTHIECHIVLVDMLRLLLQVMDYLVGKRLVHPFTYEIHRSWPRSAWTCLTPIPLAEPCDHNPGS